MEAIITIVGFLGSGKTTLLKKLICSFSEKGWNPFVILNDYENAHMDAQQFLKQLAPNKIKALSVSCICCNGIDQLRNYINGIPKRTDGITLIEANGTSDACSLMEFLGVGLNDRFLPPIQISVVDVKNWQKRGVHNDLESNQIQVSSLIILTHIEGVIKSREKEVLEALKELNPFAKIYTMDTIDMSLISKLYPSKNKVKKLEHQKSHWSSCSRDLPILPNLNCIEEICINLPKSILRVKGCVQIAKEDSYTYFERTPDGKVFSRPFNGVPITGPKLLTIGPGSEPFILERAIKSSLKSVNNIKLMNK